MMQKLLNGDPKMLTGKVSVPSVTLEKDENGWKVTWGDRWEDHLLCDEALGVVASIIYAGKAPYLRTQYEHDEADRRWGNDPPQGIDVTNLPAVVRVEKALWFAQAPHD